MTSNICIDIRYLLKKPSGIGRYIKNLTEELLTCPGRLNFFLLGHSENFSLLKADSKSYEKIETPYLPENHPFSDLWYNFYFPKLLAKKKIKVFHATSFIAPAFCPCSLITSIHDRVAKHFPETLPRFFRYYLNFNVSLAIKKSNALITISKFTETELKKEFSRIPPVHTIPLGSSCSSKKNPGQHPLSPYILIVGNLEPRKGIPEMIRGYESFRSKHPESKIKLIFCGRSLWDFQLPFELKKNSVFGDDIIFTGYVDEEQLLSLYSNASLNVIPSLYEGFGLPVLEAMQGSAPILVNSIPVLKETGGDLVFEVDVKNADALGDAIFKLLKHPIPDLEKKYQDRLKAFSWKECALKTRRVYEEMAK